MCTQVTFWNVQQLMDVKRELQPALRRNRAKAATNDAYKAFAAQPDKPGAARAQVCGPQSAAWSRVSFPTRPKRPAAELG
jgi:hypothetical protein